MPECLPPHVTPKWQSPQGPVVKSRGMLRNFESASRLYDQNEISVPLGHYATYGGKRCILSSKAQIPYTSRQKSQITYLCPYQFEDIDTKYIFNFFYRFKVNFDICKVFTPTMAHFIKNYKVLKFILKITGLAPTCFGLRTKSGSLH